MRTRSCGPAPPWPTSVSTTYERGVSSSLDITPKQRYKTSDSESTEKGYGAMDAVAPTTEQLWFLNTLVTVHARHDQGEDGISVLESLAPYGDSPPLHVHRTEDELFHVLEGEQVVDLFDDDRPLANGRGDSLRRARAGVAHREDPGHARLEHERRPLE